MEDSNITKPPFARPEPVAENFHGREIIDPYRWLENAVSAETQRFVEEQNAYTRSILEKVPSREKLQSSVEQFLAIGRVASPRIAGGKYFYERRDGRQNQPVVYVRAEPPNGGQSGSTSPRNAS
ncbi:MAG TPA: hypothetical protein VE133_06575, partial [Candidatus Sulfotelmatobacter sp.]|nr:hypothetical protein [Candidatus Sulfotelmatobacter sp.]